MVLAYAIVGYVIWNFIGYWLLVKCGECERDSRLIDTVGLALALTILPLLGAMWLIDIIRLLKEL